MHRTLSDINLTKEQMLELFKISMSTNHIALHDLNSWRGLLQLNLQIMSELLEESEPTNRLEQSNANKETLYQLNESLHRSREASEAIFNSFDLFFEPYKTLNPSELFISRPSELVRSIKNFSNYPHILVAKRSPLSLEIVFPGNILFGVLSELVKNAARPFESNRKVLINWKINSNKFQCEVHDNGAGIVPDLKNKFVPLDALTFKDDSRSSKRKNGGLKVVSRIIALSKGLLLFSKSKPLGGTQVYFEFPVIGFYKR